MRIELPEKFTIRKVGKLYTQISQSLGDKESDFELDFIQVKSIDSSALQLLLWLHSYEVSIHYNNLHSLAQPIAQRLGYIDIHIE